MEAVPTSEPSAVVKSVLRIWVAFDRQGGIRSEHHDLRHALLGQATAWTIRHEQVVESKTP